MIALSIRQPWAWLIVNGDKPVENREWPTKFRGRFFIHAGKTMTRADYDACWIFVNGFSQFDLPSPESLVRGGIIGEAELVDCVTTMDSPWFTGRYGFVLANVKPVTFIPCKGALGFFTPKLPTYT